MVQIKEIDYGIACRIKNIIYINKKLRKFPQLRSKLLEHEAEHSKGYTKKDILMDLDNKHLKGFKKVYYSFILSNPSSWIEFLPFYFYEKKFVLNPTICFLYGFLLIIIGGLLKIA